MSGYNIKSIFYEKYEDGAIFSRISCVNGRTFDLEKTSVGKYFTDLEAIIIESVRNEIERIQQPTQKTELDVEGTRD